MDKKTAIQDLNNEFIRLAEAKAKLEEKEKLATKQYWLELLTDQIKLHMVSAGAKNQKALKRKNTKIQAIPENVELETDTSVSNHYDHSSDLELSTTRVGRAKRKASVKANDNIKKCQSENLLTTKLRRPSSEDAEESLSIKLIKAKLKTPTSSKKNDESSKGIQLKIEQNNKNKNYESEKDSTFVKKNQTITKENTTKLLKRKLEVNKETDDEDETLITEKSIEQTSKSGPAVKKAHYSCASPKKQEKHSNHVAVSEKIINEKQSLESRCATRSSQSSVINAGGMQNNKKNIINETVDTSNINETLASMYEDAIGKPVPIMNSTMNPNSALYMRKIMDATVVIEPLVTNKKICNETITIQKSVFKEPTPLKKINATTPVVVMEKMSIDNNSSKNSDVIKRSSRNKKITEHATTSDTYNDLITDDDSSPERKGHRTFKGKRHTRSNSMLSEVDNKIISCTPIQALKSNKNFELSAKTKTTYTPAALFSPYAKDSVKKKIEAFEQVTVSPSKAETNKVIGRVTRTKTRALGASTGATSNTSIAQKLARKSLDKAKNYKKRKISVDKCIAELDDSKENENVNNIKSKKKRSIETSTKKIQSKTTPLAKSRILQMPSSANKNQFTTPSHSQVFNAYSKSSTVPRGNIVTNVDSFIQKSATRSVEKRSEERRRRMNEEDARRKREEYLKNLSEERKRKREEKELKNKLAREAKEKLEYEKRLKAEKEKEEKAKIAQQMQEKQKEEMEKKRLLQLQRAQEKEERRKQEELQRMQRLYEQEDQERLLAEQKRREQELEKQKQMELRRQMAEINMKNQMEKKAQLKQAKAIPKQAVNDYKIDSDPDDEETDDECKPKHRIPDWALKNVRQHQLAMQQHFPISSALRFFDAKKCTPDLKDLFKGIDPRKLKRTSSAIWKTPPRYSMMNQSMIKD